MLKLLSLVVLIAAAVGGIYFYMNFDAEVQQDEDGQKYVTIRPRDGATLPLIGSTGSDTTATTVPAGSPIRIASFHLGRLDSQKLSNRRASDVLTRVIAQFDLVAIQGAQTGNQGLLLMWNEQLRTTGRAYVFANYPGVEHCAFIFDRNRIEIDRSTLRPIRDPTGQLRYEPLTALFRVRGPAEDEAFTFKVVNVYTDPTRSAVEMALVDDAYRAARDNAPVEDDVLLLGDVGSDIDQLEAWGEMLNLTSACPEPTEAMRGFRTADRLLIDRRATTEYSGRGETLDLMRQFELSQQAVFEVSDHLPIWAEFSPYEGGQSGYMANRPATIDR